MAVDSCQACGGSRLEPFYGLRNIPVHSCLMVDSREAALDFPRGDLKLVFCEDCGFIQNRLFDPAKENYSPDYEETQAFSPRFMRFVDEICADQDRKYRLAGKTVLEIGCGKGEFLLRLCETTGCRGIGIDPGVRPERLSSPALERITFIRDFYGPAYAHLAADYVCCRHTLEHIQPVRDFMALVREAIGPREETVVFFELPDMTRVLEELAFWDIYYEHCSYFTAGSLARLFRATRFEVAHLYRAYDDQYLMLEGRPAAAPTRARLPLEDDLAATRALVRRFREGIGDRLDGLRRDLERWRRARRTVAVWGSGSKAVSYLTTLGLGEEIAAVVDINPHKWGRYLAGTGHEIVSPDRLRDIRPEVVVIMNPIYTEEIRADLETRGLAPELVPL